MKEQFTQGDWVNDGTTVYALQDSTRHGKPIKINRFQFNIQGKCSDEELLANAVLAKAAPKMYRELERQRKGLVNLIDLELIPTSHVDGTMIEIMVIDKLLAEARGENKDTD